MAQAAAAVEAAVDDLPGAAEIAAGARLDAAHREALLVAARRALAGHGHGHA
jgi:hypothetical protein